MRLVNGKLLPAGTEDSFSIGDAVFKYFKLFGVYELPLLLEALKEQYIRSSKMDVTHRRNFRNNYFHDVVAAGKM